MGAMQADKYLETYVKTGHFNFGSSRSFRVAGDGNHVVFLRSESATSPVHKLYELSVASGKESLLFDLASFTGSKEEITAEERQLRERLRENAEGISHYFGDESLSKIVCMSGSTAIILERSTKKVWTISLKAGAHSAQLSPDGKQLSFVVDGGVWRLELSSKAVSQITPQEGEKITWGMPEFIAAEEMQRYSGLWWSPNSDQLLVAKVDENGVDEHYISNPADSREAPRPVRYPMAGTKNADVSLWVFDIKSRRNHELKWDKSKFEYLSHVSWEKRGITIKVINRSQTEAEIISFDPEASFKAKTVRTQRHTKWLKTHNDVVEWWNDSLVTLEFANDVRRLYIDGQAITPPNLNVQAVAGSSEKQLYFLANQTEVPEERQLFVISLDGTVSQCTEGQSYYSALYENDVLVISRNTPDENVRTTEVSAVNAFSKKQTVKSNALQVSLPTEIKFHQLGKTKLSTAVLLPKDYKTRKKIPVIMSPYGGPCHQEVLYARASYAQEEWFVQHGYAVILSDGRGTPNRTATWEYSVHNNLADPVLEDQVTALQEAGKIYPMLDLSNVGIRGWSFGGYLAALAVLDKPDIFHAAVAGAPVTDWHLYDTFYSEQFLGLPETNQKAYQASSLLHRAKKLERPLLLVHGLSDDNVLVCNSLQLADALFQVGKSDLCNLVLLSNQTHMASNVDTTISILSNELNFFNTHLK